MPDTQPTRIALVCHGNIARSQILHHYLVDALRRRSMGVEVFSCGAASDQAYPNAPQLLAEVEDELHRRGLTVKVERTPWSEAAAEQLCGCDWVLTADRMRRADILTRTGLDPSRVQLFYAFIGEGAKDFTDTYDIALGRQDTERFARCFDELQRIAKQIADRLANG